MSMKASVLTSTALMIFGFIPLGMSKPKNIGYEIHTESIRQAIELKEEVVAFFKEKCYASSYASIQKNIKKNLIEFPYSCVYQDQTIYVYEGKDLLSMQGYLYETTPLEIQTRYFFK